MGIVKVSCVGMSIDGFSAGPGKAWRIRSASAGRR